MKQIQASSAECSYQKRYLKVEQIIDLLHENLQPYSRQQRKTNNCLCFILQRKIIVNVRLTGNYPFLGLHAPAPLTHNASDRDPKMDGVELTELKSERVISN